MLLMLHIVEQGGGQWMAVGAGELIPNGFDRHCVIPSRVVCIVADLEAVVNDVVEEVKERTVDIRVAQEVDLLSLEGAVDLALLCSG